MHRRDVLRGLGAVGGTGLLAGCIDGFTGEATTYPADATVWHALSDAEAETYEENLEQFEQENDAGWKIRTEVAGSLEDRVETSLGHGDGPELYRWTHDWAGSHYDRGFLYDAGDDLSFDPEERFTEAAIDAVTTADGAVVGLPIAGETVALQYNRELIGSPPETFDEFEAIMEEYHDPVEGEYGLAYPTDAYFVSAWLHAFGGFYFRVEDGDPVVGLDRDETKEGMELFRDRVWPYMPKDTAYDQQAKIFESGNAPLAIDGPWAVSNYEYSGVDVGVTTLPDLEGGSPTPYTGISIWYFSSMMGEDDQRRRAALDYAEWQTTNEELHVDLADHHSYIPVLSDVDTDALSDRLASFQTSVRDGVAIPNHARMSDVWGPTEDAIEAVLFDGADIDEEFDRAAENIRDTWE